MESGELLEQVVSNAMDFLDRSISDLDRSPKYSMISFYSALELFLKSRLLAEHWSLVVSKRQDPDWEKFNAGDFQSVTLEEAATRLHKVARAGLSESELAAFNRIRAHRNRVVHFYHEAHSAAENENMRQEVVRQQLAAWYHLHRLLTTKWRDVFEPWLEKLSVLDASVRKHHGYLNVVFDNCRPRLAELQKDGRDIVACPSCAFAAQPHVRALNELYVAQCLVCGFSQSCIIVPCTECAEPVRFIGEGFGKCTNCEKDYEPEDLVDILLDPAEAHERAKEGEECAFNCAECDGYHTVIEFGDGYLCASCFGEFEELEVCGWCNELNTGDMEMSYLTGCNFCEGQAGWTRDD